MSNAFARYAQLGYARLVPVIPPGVPISKGSSLYKRLNTKQDGRGKTPGIRGRDGNWFSFDWAPYEADEKDLPRWAAMQAGVGIKTGAGLIAIDADTLDEDHARTIRATVEKHIGKTPIRVGQYPKALYLIRVSGPLPYQRIEFGPPLETGAGRQWRVEVLSDGRFFVADGVHPKTAKPYTWPQPIVPYDTLPLVAPEIIPALLNELRQLLPDTGPLLKEGGTTEVSQKALQGDPETVRRAVAAIPNTSALYPSRESYRDMGYAIKAALPDDELVAWDIWCEWCERWEDGENDPQIMQADWARMKPPYRRGANWIYEQAERHGTTGWTRADIWFEDLDEPENPFQAIELNSKKPDALIFTPTPYSFVEPSALPRREWIYGTHYIRSFVSTTLASSGVGKSSLEIVEALAMASGKPLLGVKPHGQFRVWLWNGEDPIDELNRRVAAAMQLHGLTREDVGDRLYIDSGRDMEIVLARETRDGAQIVEPVERALMAAIELNAFDVLQIDPFVASHRVTENDNNAIEIVAKRWARIADCRRVSIELVHHVRKLNGGEITVEDGRGASALIAAARPVRALARMSRVEGLKLGLEAYQRRLFRFADGKNNSALPAADEGVEWMELASEPLGNGVGEGLDAIMSGDTVGVVRRFVPPEASAIGSEDERAVALALLASGEWRRDVRAGEAWAGRAIAQAFRLDVGDDSDMARAKAMLSAWIKDGTLREVTRQDGSRRMRAFIDVVSNVYDIME